MGRFRKLGGFQVCVLIVLAVMCLVFAVIYPVVIGRVGYIYNDTVFVPEQSGGGTVYSGRPGGIDSSFTVSGGSVEFRCGSKLYGPYTVVDDPSAISPDIEQRDGLRGFELYCGDEAIFRGSVRDFGGRLWLYGEDGQLQGISIAAWTENGVYTAGGVPIDPMEPRVYNILELLSGPELEHKGDWVPFALGLVICILTALSILYADELFRWSMSFLIRNAENAEPSDWELAGRYIGWVTLPIAALVVFIIGLG